ncbi:hypothetical protein VMT65_12700 [Nocardia sp. CDC153]|uniref:hypothetical protein n=1 Tax=Nocardia sp. CDC153 TaxID=3112167 RepID=UPI002DB5D9A4|nr:hypothetical protein [Nocardia sp. CDC153]MEC3953889.1 hypothetical protein [Nocardia sp. CDC153]
MAITGGITAITGTAGAVDDKATCASVNTAWDELRSRLEALDDKNSITNLRQIYVDTAEKLSAAAAAADQGSLKDALNTAAAQLNRLQSATTRDDFDRIVHDPAFTAAMDAFGTPCGL